MRRRFTKMVALLLVFLFVLPVSPVLSVEQSSPNVELTLAVGTSDLDVSSFAYDVQKAVYEKYGIPGDKIKITKAGATIVDSKDDFNWTIYDHYYSPDYPSDGSEPVEWSVYHSSNQPYFYYEEEDPQDPDKYFTDASFDDESMDYCYKRSKHIYPKGQDLVFLGYSVPAYKDFMIYPDQNTSEKTIEFTIDESGVSTHTLEGAGFLFNAGIDNDDQLNGYLVFYNYANSSIDLYKLSDVDANEFHNEEYYDILDLGIQGIELVARKGWGGTEPSLSVSKARNTDQNKEDRKNEEGLRLQSAPEDEGSGDSTKDIKVQVTNNSLKFYEDGVTIFDTTDADSDILIEDTGLGGFGPLVSYRSHYCSELSYFTFKDLTMETYRALSFKDLINQQTWGENTKRFIVNLDDDGVPEFSKPEDMNQITAYMNENNVHYIGWGKNNKLEEVASAVYNKDQAEGFIKKIGSRGIFLNIDDPNYDSYQKGIDAIADYIYNQLVPPTDDGHHHGGGGSGSDGATVQPPVVTFKDITDHWAKNDIEQLASLKLVKGYPDGTFRPDYSVTRAEFAAMLLSAFDYADLDPAFGSSVNFSDVSKDKWYYECVSRMAQEGVLFGYGDGTFRPEQQITREEVAAMVTRMLSRLGVQMSDSDLTFKDSDMVSWWARNPLGKIAPMDIIQGMPDGSFHPADNATRAQAAVMILRMLEKANLD